MELPGQVWDEIRREHYSIRIEQAYGTNNKINFMLFIKKKSRGIFLWLQWVVETIPIMRLFFMQKLSKRRREVDYGKGFTKKRVIKKTSNEFFKNVIYKNIKGL